MAFYKGKPHLAPHICTQVQGLLSGIANDGRNRSVVITGESGSGKSVAFDTVLQYLQVEQPTNPIISKIQNAICILSAFGNSLAHSSDDSSRHGLMMELQLDREQHVVGAGIHTYGLEVSRVTQPHPDERNFHVFHYLCEGSTGPERTSLQLGEAGEYRYLNQNGPFSIPGVDDVIKYQEMKSAMVALGFSAKERANVLRLLAMVLEIGNLKFSQPAGEGQLKAVKDASLEAVATLLRVEKDSLSDALCASGDLVKANQTRDALARNIYGRLHKWIVHHIHSNLCAHDFINVLVVLDPPGFEVLDERNGYEQFMRNFAAEKICKLIDDLAYSRAREDLLREQVAIPPTFTYPDNQSTLDVFEAPGVGLLDLSLSCNRTEDYINKAQKSFASHPKVFFPPKNAAGRSQPLFTVRHRCGAVEYKPEHFNLLENDETPQEIYELMGTSQCLFTKIELFRYEVDESLTGFVEPTNQTGHLLQQLAQVQRVLKATELRFIYCLRPNEQMISQRFDMMSVLREMRSGGLAASVNYLTQSLCWRISYHEFNEQFNALHPNRADQDEDLVTNVKQILVEVLGDLGEVSSDGLQFGQTKVFLRRAEYSKLLGALTHEQDKAAPDAQACVRSTLWRGRFTACKEASAQLQGWLRGALARHQYHELIQQKAELEARHAERKAEEMELLNDESKKVWAELEAEKAAQRAQEAQEAAAAAMKKIEDDLNNARPFQPPPVPEGEEQTSVDLVIASRMQDYYDGQLVVVQKELDQMDSDEREEYLARQAMGDVDRYHTALQSALERREDLEPREELKMMEAEDILSSQARILEKAFAGIKRLEQLENIIDMEEDDMDNTTAGVSTLDQEVVGIVDQLVEERLNLIDAGGETPEQKFFKQKEDEEEKWQHVESFLQKRAEERPPAPASPDEDSDGGELEQEALESQKALDLLMAEMNEVFTDTSPTRPSSSTSKLAGSGHKNYKDKYDYKYKYNMFEVAGSPKKS